MLSSGQTFAHFLIRERLGQGGMGEVYLAEDQKLHREVALKVLANEFFESSEHLQRFTREARTAARISHPNVMAIHDIGEAKHPESGKTISYIVMERINGSSLIDYLNEKQPDMGEIVRLMEKIASGLAAAHKLNIVHRDIKSSNVMVDSEGEPKILDFGLAKPLDSVLFGDESGSTDTVSQELTRAGKIVGTVAYMSPEQARGENVDIRSDIFSFGVLAYRMASGEFPFTGTTSVTTLAKILETDPPSPRAIRLTIPPDLERIIDKCLQKKTADRYQSAADLAVDLRRLRRQFDSGISESVTSLSGASVSQQPTKMFKVSAFKVVAGLAILSAIALVIMSLLSGSSNESIVTASSGKDGLAILEFENMTGDKSLDWLQTGLSEILLTDLMQSNEINLISRDRVCDQMAGQMNTSRSRSEMIKAAGELGASNVLFGSIYKLGDRIRIDARLESIEDKRVLIAEKVVGDDPFMLVDSLTEKISLALDLNSSGHGERSVASMTTSSPEAYRYYHEGMELFAKELLDESIEKFTKAIEIDSTFALAYMRIGMAHVFSGRQGAGANYLALAEKYNDKLPVQAKSKLRMYSDIWLTRDFETAFVHIKSYVSNYPDDLEGRTFYAIAVSVFDRDTVTAFAQLDTVLSINPAFQMALSFYSNIYQQMGLYEQATEPMYRIREYHPESPEPWFTLAALYSKQGRVDDAIEAYKDGIERFPQRNNANRKLCNLYIEKFDFEQALFYAEKYREGASGDPFEMQKYYYLRSNLSNWGGKFKTAIRFLHQALRVSFKTEDSIMIRGAYSSLGSFFSGIEVTDSALYYSELMGEWSNEIQMLNYALVMITIDQGYCDKMRPVLDTAIKQFKEKLPSQMWPQTRSVEKIFEAKCSYDTVALIGALTELTTQQNPSESSGNRYDIGRYSVLIGEYAKGKELLEEFVSGKNQVISGVRYPVLLYYLGMAEEGVGNNKQAIEYYTKMLSFWKKPEFEKKEIKDAKSRLARLTA